MPVVHSNGVDLNVQELGKGERTVVMVHGGWIDSLATWYLSCAPALAAHRRVLLYDLRGHGLSERTTSGYGLSSMAADLAGLVEADGAERVSVVGFSTGGAIALRYAADHPDSVERVAVVEAAIPIAGDGMLDWALDHSLDDWLEWLPESVRSRFAPDSRLVRRREEQVRALATETDAIAESLADSDVPDEALAQLTMPVLLCYGTQTPVPEARDRLERVLPNCKVEIFEGSHFLPLEVPEALSAAMETFFDG